MQISWTALFVILLCGCATVEPPTTSYNRGVAAWKQKDYAEARRQWSESVVEGEPPDALNNLGFLLFNGLGGATDREGGVSLWHRGAAEGVAEAQWHLGASYAKGQGTARDYAIAYAWLACAIANADNGVGLNKATEEEVAKHARVTLATLVERMGPEELSKGRQVADEYIAKYGKRRRRMPSVIVPPTVGMP